MKIKLPIMGVMCNKCGDIIWSRYTHDFRSCSCKSVYVDGGRDYLKCSGKSGDIRVIEIWDLQITKTKRKKKLASNKTELK